MALVSPVVILAAVAVSTTPVVAEAGVLYVAPGGSGDCSANSPCGSFDAAVSRATSGTVVRVAAGSYGSQVITAKSATTGFASNVVFEPAPGASVKVGGLDVDAAHVTIRGMRGVGLLYLRSNADFSGFDQVETVNGSAYLAGADNAFITNSRIQPAPDRDGLQIKDSSGDVPEGVVIRGNTIGPTRRGPERVHVDCIQVLGASGLRLTGNTLFQCASQGLLIGGPAVGGGIIVERNVIQLCPQRTDSCDGYDAVNIEAAGATFVHNTVIDGRTRFNQLDIVVVANILENVLECPSGDRMRGNLIAKSSCGGLPASNRMGSASFVDRSASPPDLRLAGASAGIGMGSSFVGGQFSTVDRAGLSVQAAGADAGAFELGGGQPPPAGASTPPPAAAPATTAPAPATTQQPSAAPAVPESSIGEPWRAPTAPAGDPGNAAVTRWSGNFLGSGNVQTRGVAVSAAPLSIVVEQSTTVVAGTDPLWVTVVDDRGVLIGRAQAEDGSQRAQLDLVPRAGSLRVTVGDATGPYTVTTTAQPTTSGVAAWSGRLHSKQRSVVVTFDPVPGPQSLTVGHVRSGGVNSSRLAVTVSDAGGQVLAVTTADPASDEVTLAFEPPDDQNVLVTVTGRPGSFWAASLAATP